MLTFWTAQYRYPGPNRLDITVKGNAPFGNFFAPTWKMLNDYSYGKENIQIREQNYIQQYHQIIQSPKIQVYFKQLLDMDEKVLVCFCTAGFCHRNLLAFYLQQAGATYLGEITDFSTWNNNKQQINDFHKKGYEFLSNFHPSPFIFQGILYKTVEHFYQAWKFDISKRASIAALNTPAQAKNAGKKAKLPFNWKEICIPIMETGIDIKFNTPELEQKLLNTGKFELIEGNYWHDNFWGNCYCPKCKNIPGLNNLGKLLMAKRNKIRQQKTQELLEKTK